MRNWTSFWSALATLAALSVPSGPAAAAPAEAVTLANASAAAEFARRLLAVDDAHGLPFAVVDKHAALLLVYRADGSLAGTSTVLLGIDAGDLTVPGVGDRTQAGQLRPGDSTTPAGRFDSRPGRNSNGEAVVWVDFDAAFAIHRLRPGATEPDRLRRLASANASDHRASAGCVVVPVAFYEAVVEPLLGRQRGVVYVMPEDSPWQALWENIRTDPMRERPAARLSQL